MDFKSILAVAIGGAIGAVARFIIGQVALQRFGPGFPWGTAVINVSGSFLIGLIAQLAMTRAFGITPTVRLFAATGVLGGYTTFSAFSLESLTLFGEGAPLVGAIYAAGSVILGIFAAFAGTIVGRIAAL
jgi:CrcB protein